MIRRRRAIQVKVVVIRRRQAIQVKVVATRRRRVIRVKAAVIRRRRRRRRRRRQLRKCGQVVGTNMPSRLSLNKYFRTSVGDHR